jgi:hypothetical protein
MKDWGDYLTREEAKFLVNIQADIDAHRRVAKQLSRQKREVVDRARKRMTRSVDKPVMSA